MQIASPLSSDAEFEQINKTMSPICSGFTNYNEGCFSLRRILAPSSKSTLFLVATISIYFLIRSVSTQPGQMALAVIP